VATAAKVKIRFMRSNAEVSEVLALVAAGQSDAAIARSTGIPRRTIADWRHGKLPTQGPSQDCAICSGDPSRLPREQYAYAFGLYLGDGCISRSSRTFRIRFALDAAYPQIVAACGAAIEALATGKRAWARKRPSSACVDVAMYWNHWPCLFPQHGSGRKHHRAIALAAWQRTILAGEEEALVRGLLDSDGCRVVANDRGRASVRYHFHNESADIRAIYCRALDTLGIPWTRPGAKQIAVYRKSAVAIIDSFVGPKS
jgi:hypothetical protein